MKVSIQAAGRRRDRSDHEWARLVRGDDAWYADSLGRLYWWLDKVVLGGVKRGQIQEALLLNYHIGMRFDYAGSETPDGKRHTVRLSPRGDPGRALIGKIAALLSSHKPTLTVAACSAAVVAEGFQEATTDVQNFMCLDYDGAAASGTKFQRAVHQRLAKVARQLSREGFRHPVRVVRSSRDLPLTCVYLRFRKPIRTCGGGRHCKITELLATGIYEPSQAVDVLCPGGRDLMIPTEILLSAKEPPAGVNQVAKLRDTYKRMVEPFAEPRREGVGRVFIAYHWRRDRRVGKEVIRVLAKKLSGKYEVVDGMLTARAGETLIDRFTAVADRCDYSVAIFPRLLPGANVAFEHGYFFKRLGGARAFVAGYRSSLPVLLSDDTGRVRIHRARAGSWKKEAANIVAQLVDVIP
jgi:hypothetical protein